MRRILTATIGLALLLGAASAEAALLSKEYEFRDGVILKVMESTEDGLRLDSLLFKVPARRGGRLTRTGGLLTAEVAVSNGGKRALKVAVAIALFDAEGRLVGVASGGNRIAAVKANRQQSFSLVFDGVNAEAHKAKTFRISVESKP